MPQYPGIIAAAGVEAGPSDIEPDVAWWKLDDGSGTTAVDSVGGFDLTLANMDNSNWTTGQIDGALQFNDGVTNEIAEVASDPGLEGFSAFSLSAWIHPTAHHTGSGGRIITKSTGSSSDDYSLMVSEVGVGETEVDFRTTTGGGTNHLEAGGELLSLNTWHHVVGTWDGSTMRLYLDGAETTGSPLSTTGSLVDSNQALGVGNHPDAVSRFFEGIVDDVRIYGRALTAQEVSDVFVAGGGA